MVNLNILMSLTSVSWFSLQFLLKNAILIGLVRSMVGCRPPERGVGCFCLFSMWGWPVAPMFGGFTIIQEVNLQWISNFVLVPASSFASHGERTSLSRMYSCILLLVCFHYACFLIKKGILKDRHAGGFLRDSFVLKC